jgi:F-box and leucine-rich repeat protein 10/11
MKIDPNCVYNQVSYEFSHTILSEYISSLQLVNNLDWIDQAWPNKWKHNKLKYPVVQYYLKTSANGSFMNFHIDFGVTSVWYHIISGRKDFCLIEPSPDILKIYEQWNISDDNDKIYLPDLLLPEHKNILCE